MLQQLLFVSSIVLSAAVKAQNPPISPPAGGAIDIWVQSGSNLLKQDSGSLSDPFVKMHIVDAQGVRTYLGSTARIKDDHFPVWTEDLGQRGGAFLPATGKLEFEIRDSDSEDNQGNSHPMGFVILDIATIVAGDSSVLGVHNHTVTEQNGTALQGELTIKITPVTIHGDCAVRIDRASGVSNVDTDGSLSDPYVIVRRVDAGGKVFEYITDHIVDDLNPVWTVADHGARKAEVFLPKEGQLEFELLDRNIIDGNFTSLGTASIEISKIIAADPTAIGTNAHALSTQGTLSVEISAVQKEPPVVNVWVMNGTELFDVGSDVSDPEIYVYIDHDTSSELDQKTFLYSTHKIFNTVNPVYTEEMGQWADIMLPASGTGQVLRDQVLEFEIRDRDGSTNFDEMGWVKIDVAKIIARDPSVMGTHWYPVTQYNGSAAAAHGHLVIHIEPVAFFPVCGSGKYYDSSSYSCQDCPAGTEPVSGGAGDALSCAATPAPPPATPTPAVTPTPVSNNSTGSGASGDSPVSNNGTGSGASGDSTGCPWWCWLLVALGIAALLSCSCCVALLLLRKKRNEEKQEEEEMQPVNDVNLLPQTVEAEETKSAANEAAQSEEYADL